MKSAYTLETFHFDPVKRGRILRSFIDGSDYSYAQVGKVIGATYDSLINYLNGRVQSLPFEKLFKICVITGHNVNEFLQLMLSDEDVDFADRIIWDAEVHAPHASPSAPDASLAEKVLPVSAPDAEAARTCPAMHYFVDQINDAQERLMNRYKGIHDTYTQQLVKQQEHELQVLDDRFDKSVKHLKDQIKRLERRNMWLTITLIAENVALFGVLLIDVLNHNVGWLRSYLNYSNLISLKS